MMSSVSGGGRESIRNATDSKFLQLQELEQDEHHRRRRRKFCQGTNLCQRGWTEHDSQSSQYDKVAADTQHLGVVCDSSENFQSRDFLAATL